MNKHVRNEGVGGDPYFVTEWYVVPKRGEPIGDNLFYTKRKWCGVDYLELSDTPSGVYICREPKVRKSDFYRLMLRTFNKALDEYKERVKGEKKNDS